MKPEAITAARVRLDRGLVAVGRLEQMGFKLADLESAWWTFLLAASGVYAKLEQGSKGHGKSEAWYGRLTHERRTDPLLSYVHHARNAEEHGLQGSAAQEGAHIVVHSKKTRVVRDGDGRVVHVIHPANDPELLKMEAVAPYLRLVRVKDARYGDKFDPPTEHLGQPLSDCLPATVARAALTYLADQIAKAEKLDPH